MRAAPAAIGVVIEAVAGRGGLVDSGDVDADAVMGGGLGGDGGGGGESESGEQQGGTAHAISFGSRGPPSALLGGFARLS